MYVDDLLTRCEDSNAAEKLQDAIITLIASAVFDIRKWVSSDSKFVSRLAATFRESEEEKIIESEIYAIKTLGIRWNPNPDQLGFTVALDKGAPFTKRQILSEVSRLFVPLGWLSQTTIQYKSFVQLLWMDKLSWDQPLSDLILQQYLRVFNGRFSSQPRNQICSCTSFAMLPLQHMLLSFSSDRRQTISLKQKWLQQTQEHQLNQLRQLNQFVCQGWNFVLPC